MGPTTQCKSDFNTVNGSSITLLWLGKNSGQNVADVCSKNKLCQLIYNNYAVANIKEIMEYLKNHTNEQIILIIPDTFDDSIVRQLYSFAALESIYIYCEDKGKPEVWKKDVNKIQRVFDDIDSLYHHLITKIIDQMKHELSQIKQKLWSDNSNNIKFIERLIDSDEVKTKRVTDEFMSYYEDSFSLSVSDATNRYYIDDKEENIDSCLTYFPCDENKTLVESNISIQQSTTVSPFIKKSDQEYIDSGKINILF